MSRKESPVVATTVLRRSARLIALRNGDSQRKPRKDLVLGSEPPRKSRRNLEPEASKRLVYSSGGSIEHGFPSLRRSLRISSNEKKSHSCTSAKLVCSSSSRMKSKIVSSSCGLRRSPRFSSGGKSSSSGSKSVHSVLSKCSMKSDGVKSRDMSRSRVLAKPKQIFSGFDDEEEVSVFDGESKRLRIEKPSEEEDVVPKADKGKGIEVTKAKNTVVDEGWTEEMELALQGAYLTAKPSPHFWKKVSKMVPGKSAQECFDRVNSSLITPRQSQPRSRATKTSLSTIPQFSLSASKLLKSSSEKTKIQQRRNNLSKKTIRHLLEKQSHTDQGLGCDLFSVLEPNTSSNFLLTPMEKGQSFPKTVESPMPCSRFAKDQTTVVSPPVLKQVKNKALHEKYIDHLHIREAKRKAASTRLVGKENIRPIDIQIKDSVRAAKDALFFDVQDATQKLKGLETENSACSSEFDYDHSDEDGSI